MPAPYNLTGITNATTYLDKLIVMNNEISGLLGTTFIIIVFSVTLLLLLRQQNTSTLQAFGGSSFLTLILGIFMYIAGLIDQRILGLVILMAIFALGLLHARG